MAGADYGIRDTVGIVASRRIAEAVMDSIISKYTSEVQKYIKNKYNPELCFKDGTRLTACPLNESSRGRRFTYAIIEKNILDAKFLDNIVYPMCAYCKDDEIFYITDSQDATEAASNIIDLIRKANQATN